MAQLVHMDGGVYGYEEWNLYGGMRVLWSRQYTPFGRIDAHIRFAKVVHISMLNFHRI